MRIRMFPLGFSLILFLASLPAFSAWEEGSQPQFSPVPQFGTTTLEKVIIELDNPALQDFKFPRIQGFQITLAAMRARLSRARVNRNFLKTLSNFLDQADSSWKKPAESRLRAAGFRRNLILYRFSIRFWARLRLVNRMDAEFLSQQADRALDEFEVETAVLQAREILAESHLQLLDDLKSLFWQAGFPSDLAKPEIKSEYFSVFNGVAAEVPVELLEQIRQLPYVKNVELDKTVQIAGEGAIPPQVDLIGAPAFWDQGLTGKYTTIAILDTGVDLKHSDLKNNIWINQSEINLPACLGVSLDYDLDGLITISDLNYIYQAQSTDPGKFNLCVNDFDADGEITGQDLIYRENTSVCDGAAGTPSAVNPLVNCADEDGNGKRDDLLGWNFYGTRINPADDHYHGTHCAGIAAGNGELRGVAPEASILSVKVLNQSGSGAWSSVMAGIDYVVNAPYTPLAQVISMSLGSSGPGSSQSSIALAVDKAVDAGVIVAVAAGNLGGEIFTVSDPGTSTKAITVAASLRKDQSAPDGIASFSSKGPVYPDLEMKPDISAPGASICAARYDSARPEQLLCGDQIHILLSGTSMATPHIAGAALLLKQKYPQFSPEQIKSLLMQTALDLNLPAHYQGAGRVNLTKASQAKLLVSPQKIYFGIDDQNASSWQSPVATVTLTNLSGADHTYQLLPALPLPAGVAYKIVPADKIVLAPGLSAQFKVSITVDNNSAPNADYPGYFHDHINIIVDQNLALSEARLDAFYIKTCFITAGCEDCLSNLQIDIFDETELYHRLYAKKSIIIPCQCNKPLNVFVTNWPPASGEDTYFFIKDNNLPNPNAKILFRKSDAKYKYLISPRDKDGSSFTWNTTYMALFGRIGPKLRIIPPSWDLNPGLVFNAWCYGYISSHFLAINFTEVSDQYGFSWDLYIQKSGRYYQFSDYQEGIDSNITYQNSANDLRHPRIEFPELSPGQSYSVPYGYKGSVAVPQNTTTSDLIYFMPPKSIYNENVRLPAISFNNPDGVNSNFYMPGIRSNKIYSRLNIYRTLAEGARSYNLSYLKSSISSLRNEIKIFKDPMMWYGVVNAYIMERKMFIILSHKNFLQEQGKKMYTIVAPLFSLQSGEADSLKLKVNMTDSQNISTQIEIDNLASYNNITLPLGFPQGYTQVNIDYPKYYFHGNLATAKLNLIIDPHNDDLNPPFIDNFMLTTDEVLTDTFHPNTFNLIQLKVSDSLPGEIERPGPMVKLYFRVNGSGDKWKELEESWPGQFIFDQRYKDTVNISLKVISWDQEGYPDDLPKGNIMEYTVEPAFIYNPSLECYDPPPLPGGFYFNDANGDGVTRIIPEVDYLQNLLAHHPENTDFKCIIPTNNGYSVLDLDGNSLLDGPDLSLIYEFIVGSGRCYLYGNVNYIEVKEIPDLDMVSNRSGKLSTWSKSDYGSGRAGFGVEYKIISNPMNCISLYGRNPHPIWTGERDQYISVKEGGKSVFEISDENGISEIQVKVNPDCVSEAQVEIEACVPADYEVIEYCNCSDPESWFICYCQSGDLPEGCDCNNPETRGKCVAADDDPPENCVFDSPYQFSNRQDQRVCAEPIIINIY